MEFGTKLDFQFLIIISVSFLVVIAVILFLLLKKPKTSWWFIVEQLKYDTLYNIMGLTALLDDIISREKNKVDLYQQSGKVAVITGGTRGIGKEVIKLLLKCDVHVIIGCRNVKVGEKLITCFRKEGINTGNATVYELDVSSLSSVKEFSTKVRETFPKIHILINNAGIMFGPYQESADGFELQFATNHLGHFLLTHLLLDRIKAAGVEDEYSRIVNVSSCAHLVGDTNYEDVNNKTEYIPAASYSRSKFAQILCTKYLDRIFKENNVPVEVFSVHPGVVDTDLFHDTILKQLFPWLMKLMFKSPEQGALPIVYAAISQRLQGKGGSYISNCEILPSKDISFLPEYQQRAFDFSTKTLNIGEFGRVL